MKRTPALVGAAVAVLLVIVAHASAGADSVRTIPVTIHFSRFDVTSLRVEAGETVRFVVTNTDPIDHEFLVGDAEMQAIHEAGTEAHHGARPGEISVPAGETVETTVTFPSTIEPGWEFACHVPGHYAFGMRGPITLAS